MGGTRNKGALIKDDVGDRRYLIELVLATLGIENRRLVSVVK
jgi:hypothetical protein